MTLVTIRGLAASLLLMAAASLAQARPSLYERLGGAEGVTAIANSLIDRVAADPRLGRSFEDTNLQRIKTLLAEQICDLSGGPCHYSGDPMKEVHAGLHISEAEFYGMVAVLRDILHERHVSMGATNELLRILAPMKRTIVEPRSAGAK
jgi:hemoglobin